MTRDEALAIVLEVAEHASRAVPGHAPNGLYLEDVATSLQPTFAAKVRQAIEVLEPTLCHNAGRR